MDELYFLTIEEAEHLSESHKEDEKWDFWSTSDDEVEDILETREAVKRICV